MRIPKTDAVMPRTTECGKKNSNLVLSVLINTDEMCCWHESRLLNVQLCPIPKGATPKEKCSTSNQAPVIRESTYNKIKFAFRKIFCNDTNSQQLFVYSIKFYEGVKNCAVLSNNFMYNITKTYIVVPISQNYEPLWKQIQEIDGTMEPVLKKDKTHLRAPKIFLEDLRKLLDL